MKFVKIKTYIDLLFCLVILPLIITLAPVEKWIEHRPFFFISLVAYLYLLYFVYRKAQLPLLFMQHKFMQAISLIVILILLTHLFTFLPFNKTDYISDTSEMRKHMLIQTIWFFFLIVTSFSISIELIIELFRQAVVKKEMEMEKSKAELALYKAQINPHFLFNTLNTLYGLVLTKSDKAESALMKFSNTLKYMYMQGSSEFLSIGEEIDYIQQYIELQTLRLNHHTHIEFHHEGDDYSLSIATMIFITFVENCFKYGVSSDSDCTIAIHILVKQGHVYFSTKNRIIKHPDKQTSKFGIQNCRQRLNLLYPNRYDLQISEQNNTFKVNLNIQLA